jgi:drug/metabolite transporter (DMT)-like permease
MRHGAYHDPKLRDAAGRIAEACVLIICISAEFLYGLVLLAAAAHAVWNALIKRAADATMMMAAIRLVGLLFGLAIVPFVPWPTLDAWVLLVLASVATFAYYVLLLQSYRIGGLSLVYPLARGSAPVIMALVAFLVISERPGYIQLAGVGLITMGILALMVGNAAEGKAIAYALATGVSISAYSFLGGLGVRSGANVFTYQAWLEVLTGIGFLLFVVIRRPGDIATFARANGGVGLGAGALSVAGYLAFLTAAQVLPMAPIAALRECSVFFGTLIGALVFKEGFGMRRIIAATLVVAGILAIAGGLSSRERNANGSRLSSPPTDEPTHTRSHVAMT